MTNLSKKLGEMEFDGLFTDVVPAVQVRGGIIRKQTTSAVTLKRGTILAKSYGTAGDGKLVIHCCKQRNADAGLRPLR